MLPGPRPRRLLPLALALVLAGCGFRPMYAPAANGARGPAAEGLAAISVGLIPERAGQLLRLALQERFERGGSGVARRYDLTVTFVIAGEPIAIQQDTSATWTRFVGVANYTLTAQDPARTTLLSGTARSVDGMNVFNQQLFASDLETEAIQQRIAEAVADQIALRLASYFDHQATQTAANPGG